MRLTKLQEHKYVATILQCQRSQKLNRKLDFPSLLKKTGLDWNITNSNYLNIITLVLYNIEKTVSKVTFGDDEIASFDQNECDISLMATPNSNEFKNSESNHLYLYKDQEGVIFYFIENDKFLLVDNNNQALKSIKKKFLVNQNYFIYNDNNILTSISNITANLGHTYKNDYTQRQKKVNQLLEKLFNTPQIFRIEFDGGGNKSDSLCMDLVPHIAKSTTLKSLTIKNNPMSFKELDMIVDALMINKTCVHLNLKMNCLEDELIPTLLKLLKKNQLEMLNLEHSNFTDAGLRQLIKGIQENRSLKWLNIDENDCPNEYNVISTKETKNALDKLLKTNPSLEVIFNDQYLMSNKSNLTDISVDNENDIKVDMIVDNNENETIQPISKKQKIEVFLTSHSPFIFMPLLSSTLQTQTEQNTATLAALTIQTSEKNTQSSNQPPFFFKPPPAPIFTTEQKKVLDDFELTFRR